MDKKITELKEIENVSGLEYVVLASEQHAENYKIKVDDFIEDSIEVDDALSETSENPVQNKVITKELNELEDRIEDIEDTTGRLLDLHIQSVDTVTLDPNENAKVEVYDLGTDNNDTKNLAFKFYIPRGATGQQGQQGITGVGGKTVFVFKHSEEKPERPSGGSWDPVTNIITYPVGWSPTDDMQTPIWMSYATFNEFRLVIDWSDPIRITGEDGTSGTDGIRLEFIYKQAKDESVVVTKPYSNPDVNDYVPKDEGWYDHPQGVSSSIQCEYVCTRQKNDETGKWQEWDGPVLWSKYGANGKDGDGVEYIYQLTKTEVSPATPGRTASASSPTTNYNDREFIPAHKTGEQPWTDNPTGVSQTFLCEWVSTRKFRWDTNSWGDWSRPALWGKYGKNGADGQDGQDGADGANGATSFLSIVFCRTNTAPMKPDSTDGSYSQPVPEREVEDTYGNGLGIYWSDGIPTGEAQVWSTQRIFSFDGEAPQQAQWSDPTIMTDTATYDVEFSPNEICPEAPVEDKSERWKQGWYDPTLHPDYDMSTSIWRAERWKKNGEWSEWMIYRIKGERGNDGTSITILGSYDSYEELESARQNGTLKGNNPPNMGDTYLIDGECWIWDGDSWLNGGSIKGEPGRGIESISTEWAVGSSNSSAPTTGWDDNSPATTDEKPYIWKKYRFIYTDGTSSPIYYECVGKQGDKGIDGEGIEYIYYLTDKKQVPTPPTSNDPIESNPGANAWNDDPQDPTINYKYLYISEHTKKNDVWGPYSTPVLWDQLAGPFVHIKYANSLTEGDWTGPVVNGVKTGEDPGKYIGIRVDYNEGDSMIWTDYTWSKFTGDDGFNREYIFILGNNFNSPPSLSGLNNSQTDQFVPTGWYADPLSPDPNNKYCWACHRDKVDGEWSAWKGNSTNIGFAYLFSMYAESVKGATGQQGPILYASGEWVRGTYSQNGYMDGSTWVATATPYVFHEDSYYVLNVQTTTEEPGTGEDWLKMETFKAIYADIGVFGNALVGNAVFNGKYIFSQLGEGDITQFDGQTDDPYSDASGFKPNWCVNLETGQMWTSTGKCYFAADGSGYLASDNINWDSTADNISFGSSVTNPFAYVTNITNDGVKVEEAIGSITHGTQTSTLDARQLLIEDYYGSRANHSSLTSSSLSFNSGNEENASVGMLINQNGMSIYSMGEITVGVAYDGIEVTNSTNTVKITADSIKCGGVTIIDDSIIFDSLPIEQEATTGEIYQDENGFLKVRY